ncbi:MAG: YkvA family protein [Gemmatimonadales bacterium]
MTFELEDEDLAYFQSNMRIAQRRAAAMPAEDVLRAAELHMVEAGTRKLPKFVEERVTKLGALIEMMRDEEWRLPEAERKNVLAALVYLSEPEDLIPDEVPVLGYVDDAIMIELVVREMKPEIDAFVDFCRYRERFHSQNPNLSREQYLAIKRRELHERMRRRREKRFSGSQGSGRPRFRLF